jgi:hypothetical protein
VIILHVDRELLEPETQNGPRRNSLLQNGQGQGLQLGEVWTNSEALRELQEPFEQLKNPFLEIGLSLLSIGESEVQNFKEEDMRSCSTSFSEQSEDSSREESPSPQTPLDAGASFVHNAIANMNYRKSAIAFQHPCRILYFYTPSF